MVPSGTHAIPAPAAGRGEKRGASAVAEALPARGALPRAPLLAAPRALEALRLALVAGPVERELEHGLAATDHERLPGAAALQLARQVLLARELHAVESGQHV